MKVLFISLLTLAVSLPTFAARPTLPRVDEEKQAIKRLSDRIYSEVDYSDISLEKLQSAKRMLRGALAMIRGKTDPTEPTEPVYNRSECIKTVMGYSYGPDMAAKTCDSISTVSEFSCLSIVMSKSYGPTRAATACAGIQPSQIDCFKYVLDQSYGPDRARSACITQ